MTLRHLRQDGRGRCDCLTDEIQQDGRVTLSVWIWRLVDLFIGFCDQIHDDSAEVLHISLSCKITFVEWLAPFLVRLAKVRANFSANRLAMLIKFDHSLMNDQDIGCF